MKTKHRTAARAKQRQRDTEYTQPNWLDKLADDLRKREQAHRWPVPEFFVEEYEPRAKKRGWRVTERGMKMFRDLGWGYTAATEGKDHA